jgi:hypothetical protein
MYLHNRRSKCRRQNRHILGPIIQVVINLVRENRSGTDRDVPINCRSSPPHLSQNISTTADPNAICQTSAFAWPNYMTWNQFSPMKSVQNSSGCADYLLLNFNRISPQPLFQMSSAELRHLLGLIIQLEINLFRRNRSGTHVGVPIISSSPSTTYLHNRHSKCHQKKCHVLGLIMQVHDILGRSNRTCTYYLLRPETWLCCRSVRPDSELQSRTSGNNICKS